MNWLFFKESTNGWRWELWDKDEMFAYEVGFKTVADAVAGAAKHGYVDASPSRDSLTSIGLRDELVGSAK
ncbi:MAG: hypothetical protein JWO70_2187 [Betaproteobacteria bacterium]|nr:hypothetical protein [Betaproteobacteria bacterium]